MSQPGGRIHPTAVIDKAARLGKDVDIGPYAVIEADVSLGDRCRVEPHVYLRGPLVTGADNVFGFSSCIGHDPQVRGDAGPFGSVRIGSRCVFRENVQVHRSRYREGVTEIGDDVYLMTGAHIGHDARVASFVTLANLAVLGGHVHVEERAFISAYVGIHQFCKIGTFAMIGGLAAVTQDVPPYVITVGTRGQLRLYGLNRVALKRSGFPAESVRALKEAYRLLFRRSGNLEARLADVEATTPEVTHLVEFIRSSRRGVVGIAMRDASAPDTQDSLEAS